MFVYSGIQMPRCRVIRRACSPSRPGPFSCEQPDDRDREHAAELARDASPRDRLRERLRAAEMEGAHSENRGRPDPDEEREQVQVENNVVRVQENHHSRVDDAAAGL